MTAFGPTISEISTYAGSNSGRMDLNLSSTLLTSTLPVDSNTIPKIAFYLEDFGIPSDPSIPAILEVYPTSRASADTWTQVITQTAIPPVPGPLPILGAGAAFGFSRKLRRRIAGRS